MNGNEGVSIWRLAQARSCVWWREAIRIAVIALAAFGSAGLHAQSDKTEVGEIGVYAGTMVGPLSGNATVGGHFGGAFSRYAIGMIDTSYTSIGSRTLAIIPSNVTTSSSILYDFNFGFHIRVPVGKGWAPYGIMSLALLYNRYEAVAILPDDSISHSVQSISRVGFDTGGGVRYYFNDQVGVRGEFRQTISSTNFGRVLFGIVYQFSEGSF